MTASRVNYSGSAYKSLLMGISEECLKDNFEECVDVCFIYIYTHIETYTKLSFLKAHFYFLQVLDMNSGVCVSQLFSALKSLVSEKKRKTLRSFTYTKCSCYGRKESDLSFPVETVDLLFLFLVFV